MTIQQDESRQGGSEGDPLPRSLKELQAGVGEWSRSNFGSQESKTVPDLVLGSLAPLMGVGEEIGELCETLGPSSRLDEHTDAVGDILIYLCDYAEREGFQLADIFDPGVEDDDISVPYGQLLHVTLKRHQGIRGYDQYDHYVAERNKAVGRLLRCLCNEVSDYHSEPALKANYERLVAIGVMIYSKVVLKRDWKAEPEQAADLVDDNGPSESSEAKPPEVSESSKEEGGPNPYAL